MALTLPLDQPLFCFKAEDDKMQTGNEPCAIKLNVIVILYVKLWKTCTLGNS